MTVDRPVVFEAELLPEARGDEEVAHARLDALGASPDLAPEGQVFDEAADFPLGVAIEGIDAELVDVLAQGADVRGDGHIVVVEDHDHVRVQVAGVVERFEGHAGGHRAIADDRDHAEVLTLEVSGRGHANPGGNGSARVARAKGIVGAFLAVRESRQTLVLADRVHALFASREHLMDINLMAYVPDDLVFGRIKEPVQYERKLNNPEVRSEVPAITDAVHGVDKKFAYLGGEEFELLIRKRAKVRWRIDAVKQLAQRVTPWVTPSQ